MQVQANYDTYGSVVSIELPTPAPEWIDITLEMLKNRDPRFLRFDYVGQRPAGQKARVTLYTLTGKVVYNVERYAFLMRTYRLRLLSDDR